MPAPVQAHEEEPGADAPGSFPFSQNDNTYVAILAGAWIAEAAHFHKLYAQKEGRANSQKYMEAWVNQTAEKYGPDQAARFAEIVLTTNTMQ